MGVFKRDLSIVCSDDDLSPVLQNVVFRDGYAICTDGSILVKHRLDKYDFTEEDIEALNGKHLHRDSIKKIYGYDFVEVVDDELVCRKGGAIAKFPLLDDNDLEGSYPNIDSVIPDLSFIDHINCDTGISLRYIEKVKKITLQDDRRKAVKMRFFASEKGTVKSVIFCGEHYDWDEELILVMPVSINEN